MAHTIPFHQVTFRPKLAIKGNDESPTPVEFEISAAGGPDRARVKSLMYASSRVLLSRASQWTPEVHASVLKGFEVGGAVFERTVDAVRNLTVPASMALKAGVLASLAPGRGAETPVPITTGQDFAKIAGYCPILAFEVLTQILRLSDEGEIDLRFFDSLITSLATPTGQSGSAATAKSGSGGNATAAGPTPPA